MWENALLAQWRKKKEREELSCLTAPTKAIWCISMRLSVCASLPYRVLMGVETISQHPSGLMIFIPKHSGPFTNKPINIMTCCLLNANES